MWIVALTTVASGGLQIVQHWAIRSDLWSDQPYSSTDPNASIATSPADDTCRLKATVGWEYVSVNLTADATTELLSFLAWGDNGSTVNLPPMVFLSGVNSPPRPGAGALDLGDDDPGLRRPRLRRPPPAEEASGCNRLRFALNLNLSCARERPRVSPGRCYFYRWTSVLGSRSDITLRLSAPLRLFSRTRQGVRSGC